MTELLKASRDNDCRLSEAVIAQLITAGAEVNITDIEGKTALIYVVQNGSDDIGLVRELAGADAKYTHITDKEKTVDAVRQGHNESVVRELINAGADVNITDKEGKTALFYALQQRSNESLTRMLTDAGSGVNMDSERGKIAWLYATQLKLNINVLHALIDAGVQVDRTDKKGKTALFYAVKHWFNKKMVHVLIDAGADVNITDNEGKTALFSAVQQGVNESVVHALIDAGADINITDNDGETALFSAVQEANNESVVQALIDAGADVNITDVEGKTALFYAITHSLSLTIYLLKNGANLNLENNYNCLIFLTEKCYESTDYLREAFKILVERKMVTKKQIFEAIISVLFLKTLRLQWRGKDLDFITLLKLAGEYASFSSRFVKKILKTITEQQKKPSVTEPEAIRKILRRFANLGAKPNCVDSDGNTALHHAIQLSRHGASEETVLKICNELIEMGISIHTKNLKGETPLLHCLVGCRKWSEVKTQLAVCEFFIKQRSMMQEKTKSGQSVLHLILELLRQLLLDKEMRRTGLRELIRVFREIVSAYKEKELAKDKNGNTPLHLWAKLQLPQEHEYSSTIAEGYTFKELMKVILDQLRNINVYKVHIKNRSGETPLHVCKTWTAMELFLNAGANPKHTDSLGRQPLLVAAMNIEHLPNPKRFYPDVLQQPKAFWKMAVCEKGFDPWAVDRHGESLMSVLIKAEFFDLAKGMVEFACEDKGLESESVIFPLMLVLCKDKSTCARGKIDLVKIILESGKCLVSGKEEGKDSPLHFCCMNIVKNPNDVDNVHWAIAENLLLYEADCTITNSSGLSCLDIAEGCCKLKELLSKPIDIDKLPLRIEWVSNSERHKEKLAKVARGRRVGYVESYWYHKDDLASGAFGAVFAGINKNDGREVAVKRIEKTRMKRQQDKREITSLLALAECEQVVRYLYFSEDEYFSYIILELMEGNLEELLNKSTTTVKKREELCKDVVKGLQFLHNHEICHRDLKPTNILYKNSSKLCLKIADFGFSRRMDNTGSSTSVGSDHVGTRSWIALEVLKSTKTYSESSDVFSCGLVLHYFLTVKRHPFAPTKSGKRSMADITATENNIIAGKMEGWDESLNPEADHLLKAMLHSDDSKRPSADKALEHPFFWSNTKKVDVITAVANQSEFQCPRIKRTHPLTAVETDLEARFRIIVKYKSWKDPGYAQMPDIYTEMTKKRKSYDIHTVVELVRFIRNSYAHISDSTRQSTRKQLLENFVFFEYFPNLVIEVYKAITTHGWNQKRDEIKSKMED